jgi:release factor glutamine methyltransferase
MKQQIDYIISQLRGFYPEEELRELAYWVIEETTGLTRTQILTECKGTQIIPNIEIILQKLRAHEPIQYIFGHTEWRGLDLLVTPATLIPRPETAELIDWILESCDRSKPLHVLDIGTGSGCIAIALKKSAPLWQVIGIDISPDALEIAHENAKRNSVEVEWTQADILSPITNYRFPILDIIVSNPPYICHREKANMDARVLDYEPHSALFVPDDEPLLFYRRIAAMKSAKSLYFEINEAYGKEVCDMLKGLGYTDIQLKHDIYGKPRMVFGRIEA